MKANLTPSPPTSDTVDRLGSYPEEAITTVTMAVAAAIPVTLPLVLVKFNKAEIIPYFPLSLDPKTALVLGE
ncbi:MAG: hypothetical protein IIB11_05300 [Chloroflexi bacterium]|nr:hypothetical protein [Chloroflexota bacterium]